MTGATDAELSIRLADPDPGGRPVDVVIDTDVTNEIDDQFAVVWALLRPDRLRIRALHACPWTADQAVYLRPDTDPAVDRDRPELTDTGLTPRIETVDAAEGMRRAAAELRRITALAGTDIPVLDGAARSMPGPATPVPSPATDNLIRLAHAGGDEPLYVVAIGAATNVASAILLDPTIRARIVVVWTSAYPSFWPRPNASYNLAQDLHASRVLFDSGTPLVYLPGYYVGEELRVSRPELERHVRGAGRLGDYLWECFDRHWMSGSQRPGFSKVIWDLICIAWLVDPRWLSTDLVPSPILDDALFWRQQPGRHVIREAYDVNRDAIFGDLYLRLAASAGGG
jgi:purine nucleosidase